MKPVDLTDVEIQDAARGYRKEERGWRCLICGEEFEDGVVYNIGGRQYEAFRAAKEHVRAGHGSVFLYLLKALGKHGGLTDRQAAMLTLMHEGRSDREIAKREYDAENTSAVRNLRFQLKEREKQARAYLAVMEAFRLERGEAPNGGERMIEPHEGATLSDERFDITEKERDAVLKAYFDADGALRDFPAREKRKVIVLREIASRFERGRAYTEKEVNALIGWRDFATVRRYLIEYGFLRRLPDCSEYRVKENSDDD